ncbi:hypothetical protein Ahy_B09g095696 isoform B [Arachis hypogaea]|nr:hypothetical protein Ahy_B09g095696 isoform B [Arachis hypogaea]
MDAAALEQMNMMLRVGIKTPQIYSSFVQTSGKFQNLPFLKRDMYNQIGKQQRLIGGDAMACLKFLESTVQANIGIQLDYGLFGDVVAFDATYRKNKYMCPLVMFSGVNHHNQTIVFAAALVANENEQTYTWLLQQFLDALKGKAPGCVITDGHGAMKKAIKVVFPGAYHHLCAWHLLRNATSNLSNPRFTSEFKKCMMFDYDVWEFEDHWHYMVDALGLSDNQWVSDLYSRRRMWAIAQIRDNFFGGFRTTSRCEGLHSMLGKFVQSCHNLRDFFEQFMRCISQMRSREAHSDLLSVVREPVLQSPFLDLERSAAKKLTRAIFFNFRPMLFRACTLKVRTHTWSQTSDTFTLSRSANARRE